MIIGLDLDNTIISYAELFHALAVSRNLIPADMAADKVAIRNFIRSRHGDAAWRELQGRAYGPDLPRAKLFPGVPAALAAWKAKGFSSLIISHKTLMDAGRRCNLRQAALDFLQAWGVSTLVSEIHFADSRESKIALIAEKNCRIFVDDLPEVLLHRDFPDSTRPILFNGPAAEGTERVFTCPDWPVLQELVISELMGKPA